MDEIKAYKAKKKLKKKLMNRSWKLEGFHAKEEVVIRGYVYDPFDSQTLSMAGFTQADIEGLEKIREPVEVISGAVDQQFKSYVSAKDKQIKKQVELLGMLTGLYMVNTKTYISLMKNQEHGYRQFIVLLYRNKHTGEATLRPFSLVSQQEFLDGDQVKAYASQVIARDEIVNPDYFNSSPVVPIRS